MDTPSKKRGLSFTLSWGPLEAPRSAELTLGVALRIGLVAALCLGAFELGRRTEKLAAGAAAQTSGVVIVERRDSKPERAGATQAPGGAVGENSDIITPLNVRDPSALVMGPGATDPPQAAAPPPAAPQAANPPARIYPPKDPKVSPDARF